MYLVSKESIEKCRRSSNLKKLMYADVRRRTSDRFVSDKLRLTIHVVSGANKSDVHSIVCIVHIYETVSSRY